MIPSEKIAGNQHQPVDNKPSAIKQKAENLTDDVSNLLETYYKLGVLNATDKATGIASTTLTFFLTGILGLFVLLFLGFGLGYWLGEMLNNMLAGFSIVALLYITLITAIILLRKSVIYPYIRNTIIKKVYE